MKVHTLLWEDGSRKLWLCQCGHSFYSDLRTQENVWFESIFGIVYCPYCPSIWQKLAKQRKNWITELTGSGTIEQRLFDISYVWQPADRVGYNLARE